MFAPPVPSLLPSGGGGPPPFQKLTLQVRSMLGKQTLLSMRQFIEDAEKGCGAHDAELEVKDTQESEQKKIAQQEGIKALRMLFEDFEAQSKWQNEVDQESSSDSQEEIPVEDQVAEPLTSFSSILSLQEYEDALCPTKEPQLYICDDWIQPVEVIPKPGELRTRDKVRARAAKNCLLVTLMSFNVGYGSLIESYQQEGNADPPELNSITLTEEKVQTYRDELNKRFDSTSDTPASMPPST